MQEYFQLELWLCKYFMNSEDGVLYLLAGLPVHTNGLLRRKKKIFVLFSPHIVRTQAFLFFRGRLPEDV